MTNLIAVPRQAFLEERKRETLKAKEQEKNPPPGWDFVVVVDAGDEVICDVCNAEITDDTVLLDDWGAYCSECAAKKE